MALPLTIFLLLLGLCSLLFLSRFRKIGGLILAIAGAILIATFFLSLMNVFWGLAFLVSGILVLASKEENLTQQ